MGDLNTEDALSPRSTRRMTSVDDNDVMNDLTYQRISVGLLEDPEIQNVTYFTFVAEEG